MGETGSEQKPELLRESQGVENQMSQPNIPGSLGVTFFPLTSNTPFPQTSTLKRHPSARKTTGANLALNLAQLFISFGSWVSHLASEHPQAGWNNTNVIAVASGSEQVVCSHTAWGQISPSIVSCVTLGGLFRFSGLQFHQL